MPEWWQLTKCCLFTQSCCSPGASWGARRALLSYSHFRGEKEVKNSVSSRVSSSMILILKKCEYSLHSCLHPPGLRAVWLPGSNQRFPENLGLSRSLLQTQFCFCICTGEPRNNWSYNYFCSIHQLRLPSIICCHLSPSSVPWL